MKIEIGLFGALREYEPGARLELDVPAAGTIADVRAALMQHGRAHWPGFREGLLQRSAFASERAVLREADPVPEDRRLTVLPPVGGG